MFTGIVESIGTVTKCSKREDFVAQITHTLDSTSLKLGSSICCNGVCLTITEMGDEWFNVTISATTLSCTTLSNWQVGSKINLERSLRVGGEMSGHIVTGHVDGVAEIVSVTAKASSHELHIKVPASLQYFIARKGSLTIDGVSLTVNDVQDNIINVNLIPYTYEHTIFQYLQEGSEVNIEIDILARYVERMMQQFR